MTKTLKNSAFLSSLTLYLLSTLLFITALYFYMMNLTLIIMWEIMLCWNTMIYFPIILDPLGMMFSSIVLFISANVMVFSQTYMAQEPFKTRFTHLVLLFIISMNMLIYFPHMITLLLGWDGLGLVSFLLVIYYQNPKSLGAGMITALTNRIGDAMLLLAIGWSINLNNWFIISMWNSPSSNMLTNFIIFSILLAAMTKSAQMPFSSWLPAAMAAPTPVSALVHSSTLVTAGVFLLIRFYPFLSLNKTFNLMLLITASFTMLMAGLAAMLECDLKKIIALSTLSQLGVMMGSLALGFPKMAFFHLATHALFKALLFICAGSIIDLNHHSQDLRSVGNLTNQMPMTMTCFLIANMSLCGLPFMSGFYSKDMILETSIFYFFNWIPVAMFFLATALTMMYSLRLTFIAVWSPMLNYPTHYINNNDMNITVPAMNLTLGAIMFGSTLNWITTPISQDSFLPMSMKTLPLLVTMIGALLIWLTNSKMSSKKSPLLLFNTTHEATSMMWYLTPLSTQGIMSFPLSLAHHLHKNLDSGWNEAISAQGLHLSILATSKKILAMQKNHIMNLISLFSLFLFLSSIFFFAL